MTINLSRKCILSDIKVTNISESFTHKMAVKPEGIDMDRNYVTVTVCIGLHVLRTNQALT